jgi:hypothetical protein
MLNFSRYKNSRGKFPKLHNIKYEYFSIVMNLARPQYES